MTEQIKRISQMEGYMNEAEAAAEQLNRALDRLQAAESGIGELFAYYGSRDWHEDLAADEERKLPRDLSRGILSEDGIYNLIGDYQDLAVRLVEFAARMLKR